MNYIVIGLFENDDKANLTVLLEAYSGLPGIDGFNDFRSSGGLLPQLGSTLFL